MNKISKQCKIDVIAFFFAKKNQRLTNLSKAPMSKLDEVIAKYNIDFESELKAYCDALEKRNAQYQKDKEEQEARIKKQQEEQERMVKDYMFKWNNLIPEYRDNIITQKTKEIREANERLNAENERLKQRVASQFGVTFNGDTAQFKQGFIFQSNAWTQSENFDVEYTIKNYEKFRDQIDYYNDLQEPEGPPPDERKCLIVNYTLSEKFKIPKGIDLDNKYQVKGWEVRWNELHIYLVDGEEVCVRAEGWTDGFDYKRPDDGSAVIQVDDDDDDDDNICVGCGASNACITSCDGFPMCEECWT